MHARWPDNLIPVCQPAHSPELNPIERVWQFIKQQFKGEVFLTLVELRERLNQVLQQITPELWQFAIFLYFHSGSFILCSFILNWYKIPKNQYNKQHIVYRQEVKIARARTQIFLSGLQ